MNKLYILAALIFGAFSTNAQVDIHWDDQPGTVFNGQTVNLSGSTGIIYSNFRVVNTTGANADYIWRRVVLSSTVTFADQICDNLQCYDCTGTSWDRPATITIAPADSTLLQPKVDFTNGGGTVEMRYYVMDGSNTLLDSVDITFNSTVGFEEEESYAISAYPNPANDNFTIELSQLGNAEMQVNIYNVLGEQVSSAKLVNGVNKLNVEAFNNGVYFYSVLRNNKVVETKKLIIRK